MFRIIDKGLGWHVVGPWYGEDRVVHRPTPVEAMNPFHALRSCIRWVNDNA